MKRIKKFQKGGFSVEGFRRNSPDVNNPVNYINSSNISMRGVDFPVHATDNTGVSKLLMPGNEYRFPGNVVREIPLKQVGGFNKQEVPTRQYIPKLPPLKQDFVDVVTNTPPQATMRASDKRPGVIKKAADIARNPMTALQYKVQGQDIPDNLDYAPKNKYDDAMNIINPMTYLDAAGRTVSLKNFRDTTQSIPDRITNTLMDVGVLSGISNEVKRSYFPNSGTASFAEPDFVNQQGAKWHSNKPQIYDIDEAGRPIVYDQTSGKLSIEDDPRDDPTYNALEQSESISSTQKNAIKNAKFSPEDTKRLKDIKDNHNIYKSDLDEWNNYQKSFPDYIPERTQLRPESQHLSDEVQGVQWNDDGPSLPNNYIYPTDADFIKTPAKGGIPNGTSYTTKSGKTYQYFNDNFPKGHLITPEGLGNQIRIAEQNSRPLYQQIGLDFKPGNNPTTNPLLFAPATVSNLYSGQKVDTPQQWQSNDQGIPITRDTTQKIPTAEPQKSIKKFTKQRPQQPTIDTIKQQHDSQKIYEWLHSHNDQEPILDSSKGWLEQYGDGGKINPPIYTSDPNAVKSYNDSLYLYNWANKLNTDYKNASGNDNIEVSPNSTLGRMYREYTDPKLINNYSDNSHSSDIKMPPKGQSVLDDMDAFQKTANKTIKPINIRHYVSNVDNAVKDMVSVRSLWDLLGVTNPRMPSAQLPEYAKPQQPVIYQQPTLGTQGIVNSNHSPKVPTKPQWKPQHSNIQQLPIGQPDQLSTPIEQQQFQPTSLEPVRNWGHTYNSDYLGDVTIDGVQQKDRGGKIPKDSSKFIDSNEYGGHIMQHGGVNGIPMIPDPMPTNPLSRDGIFGNDRTAPMQSMDSYPHIKRMNEIQDSLTNEAQNHIDNKQYYGENTIKLNNGNFRGANVDTQLIDDIIASAKRKKVDPWTMLGVAGQESALGANGYWNKDQHQVMSGWNAANNIKPETDNLFLADHRVPGVNAVKGHTGIGAHITNADSTEHYLTQHPQLIDNYRNSQGAKIPQGKVPLMDLTADYIKQKGVQGYNPGDPDYTNKVNKRIQELKTDPVMKKYVAGKKTMQDGGPTQNMRDNYENAMGWMQSNKYDVNNPALRHNSNIGKGYFDQYNNANPGKQFNTTDIPVMQKYFQDNANSGQVRSTNPYNRDFSPVDNYPADQTLNSRQMTYQTQNGNNVQNFGTNQNAALSSVNSWKQLPPQWQANDQNIPMANNTGYRPTPRGTARTQQNNWHTGENTDYSIDSTRTAQMGGNYLGYMEQEPAREMMQSGGMITAGVTPIDNRKQPFGKKGYFWNGERFEKSTGSTVNGTAFSKYGGELPRALEFAYLENGGYVDDDGDIDEMKHGGIHIKPENKGKFTAYKQRTGKTTEEALHSKDPHVRQMANFARNSKSWSHKQMGGLQKFMQGGGGMDIPGASNVGVVNNNSQETVNEAYAPVQNAYNNSIYNSPNNQQTPLSPDNAGGGNNGYTSQHKQQYPWGDALGETANIAMGYGELIKGRNQQRDLHGYQQSHGQTDTAFGAQKLDTSGQKGDYSINTGNFRPNQQNFSAPGYFPGQMALGGQVEGIHDLDEHTINDLRNKGYRIEYL